MQEVGNIPPLCLSLQCDPRNGSTSLLHSCPTLLPVYPSNPICLPHTCPRRNGKDWECHHFVVINIHNILLGLVSTLCPKRNQNNLPKTSWITWEPGFESMRPHLFPAPCGSSRHWHHIHNSAFRGNKGNVGVVPIPVSIQALPDLGISLPHSSPNNLFLLNLGEKKTRQEPWSTWVNSPGIIPQLLKPRV